MQSFWNRTETKIFLTIELVYGFYVALGNRFGNINALCIAMVDHGTFEIDQRVVGDYSIVDGKHYCGYSPGAAWILAPLYWCLRPLCRLAPADFEFHLFSILAGWLVTIPLAALCIVALYRMLRQREFSEQFAILGALAFGFGTMWFVYARRQDSYSFMAAAFVFLSFVVTDRSADSPRRWPLLWLAGFLASLAIVTDYKLALAVLWIGLFLVIRHRSVMSLLVFGLGALPLTVLAGAYNWHLFGHALYTPAKFQTARFGDPLQVGMVPLQGSYKFNIGSFWNLIAGSRTGFFTYMPVLLLSIVGMFHAIRQRNRELRAILVPTAGIFLTYAVLAAGLSWWWAGGERVYQGPATRYLIPAVPFVVFFAAVGMQHVRPWITKLLLVASVAIAWTFVLSANYGKGESLTAPGWENSPLIVQWKHIAATFGAESPWFYFLSSSHLSFSRPLAALLTWCGFACLGLMLWRIWRVTLPSAKKPEV